MHEYILFAIPFFLLMVGLEAYYSIKEKKEFYRFNDTISNLSIGIGSEATGLFFKLIIFGAYIYVYDHWSLFHIPPTWWSFLLVLILYDLCFYWAHHMLHKVNIFWGAHIVHHSSEEYNLSVALRQSWIESVLAFFIFIPIPMLGFDPIVFVPAAALDSLYQFWIHTRTVKKLPRWYEKIFNTPSHHRVHHARNPIYIDKNYGGILIIWDRIFGTFQEEEETPVFGITTPLNSWNPVWANLHYYKILFGKLHVITHPVQKIKLLFKKPGWMPDEYGGYQNPPAVSTKSYIKFDAKNNPQLHTYLTTQLFLTIGGLMAYMYYFETLSLFFQISIFAAIIFSIVICCAVIENKLLSVQIRFTLSHWIIPSEYLKLVSLMLLINSYYYFYAPDWFIPELIISSFLFILFNIWFTMSWKYFRN
ncbi:MAG: sterol desaturase family protein [Chitinophagales bacterium]